MQRRLGQAAVIFLLCVWMLGPVIEQVDPWDIFPDFGDGLILLLTALAAFLGLALCLALLALMTLAGKGTASRKAIALIPRVVQPRPAGRLLLQPLRV